MSDSPHLPISARRLLTSFLFLGLAQPIVSTFVGVFLWRQGKSFPVLIAYTLAFYLFLPLGFLLSYRFIGRVTHRFLFLLGTIGSGLIPLLLIFSPTFLPIVVISFGALFGVSQGFLYSTRNYLTLHTTTKESRLRFSSVESLIATSCGLVVPFIVGWGLELGTKIGWFSLTQGYRWMGLIACLFLGIAGWILHDRSEPLPARPKLKLFPLSGQWKLLRSMDFIQGVISGVTSLLPIILTILFIGMEGAIGTFRSIGAIVTALSIFLAGRFVIHDQRLPILSFSFFIDLLAAAAVVFLPLRLGVIIFIITSVGTSVMRWWVTVATMYHAVEVEQRLTGSSREALLLDREFVLDMGRAVGLLLFLFLYSIVPAQSPFIAIVFIAMIQLTIYPLCRALDKEAAAFALTSRHSDEAASS